MKTWPWQQATSSVLQTAPRSVAWCFASSLARRSCTCLLNRTASWCPPRSACRCPGPDGQVSAAFPACYGGWCRSSSSTVPPGWNPGPRSPALLRTEDHTHRSDSVACRSDSNWVSVTRRHHGRTLSRVAASMGINYGETGGSSPQNLEWGG